jgi:hypothetical protein
MVKDSSQNLVPNLPSWVADLSCHTKPFLFRPLEKGFTAGCGVKSHNFEVDNNVLILHELLLDRIALSSETITDITEGQGILRLLQIFNCRESIYIHSAEPQCTAIQRLFIADQLRSFAREMLQSIGGTSHFSAAKAFRRLFYGIFAYGLKVYDQRSQFQMFLDDPPTALRILAERFGIPEPSAWLLELLRSGKEEWGDDESTWMRDPIMSTDLVRAMGNGPYVASWNREFICRRYFRTQHDYLGLSVQTIQSGDGVYLIAGAAVPYVFRPVSENSKDGFRLIGEAYVHGVMYGEALAKGTVKFERWKFIDNP